MELHWYLRQPFQPLSAVSLELNGLYDVCQSVPTEEEEFLARLALVMLIYSNWHTERYTIYKR
jgi:hypothetical protein